MLSDTETEIIEAVNTKLEQDKRLISAILQKDSKLVERLLREERVHPDGHPLSLKGPPIHLAVQIGSTTIVDILVKYGANVDNNNGPFCTTGFRAVITPLHLAVKAGNSWMTRKLASLGANADIIDSKGTTARQIAYSNRKLAAVLNEGVQAYRRNKQKSQSEVSTDSLRQDVANLRENKCSLSCSDLFNKPSYMHAYRSQSQHRDQREHRLQRSTSPSRSQLSEPHKFQYTTSQNKNINQTSGSELQQGTSASAFYSVDDQLSQQQQSQTTQQQQQQLSWRSTVVKELDRLSKFVDNQISAIQTDKRATVDSIFRVREQFEYHDKLLQGQYSTLDLHNDTNVNLNNNSSRDSNPFLFLSSEQEAKVETSQVSNVPNSKNKSSRLQHREIRQSKNQRFSQDFDYEFDQLLSVPESTNRISFTNKSRHAHALKEDAPRVDVHNMDVQHANVYKADVRKVDAHYQDVYDVNVRGVDAQYSENAQHENMPQHKSRLSSELTLNPESLTNLSDQTSLHRLRAGNRNNKKHINKSDNGRPRVPKLDLSRLGLFNNNRQLFQQPSYIL